MHFLSARRKQHEYILARHQVWNPDVPKELRVYHRRSLTLILGIGANTAIFSVMNGVLLRPLPYVHADQIVTVWQNNLKEGIQKEEVPPATFIDWKEHSRSFEEIAAASRFGFDLSSGGEPERLRAFRVTDGFFEILGTNPLYGRTLRSEDYKPGQDHVVVLSHSLWAQRFGSDPNIIGQSILLDDEPYTIVGVMPSAFQFPENREVWAPKIFSEEERTWRGVNMLVVIGRLKSGITTQTGSIRNGYDLFATVSGVSKNERARRSYSNPIAGRDCR